MEMTNPRIPITNGPITKGIFFWYRSAHQLLKRVKMAENTQGGADMSRVWVVPKPRVFVKVGLKVDDVLRLANSVACHLPQRHLQVGVEGESGNDEDKGKHKNVAKEEYG
jgi:hypothetical protein